MNSFRKKLHSIPHSEIINWSRRILLLVLLIVILIRPTIATEGTKRSVSNLNVWFVVDATGSMVGKDVDNGNTRRFEKVKDDITAFVTGLPGAKYSLIVQDFTSYLASPMTLNADATISAESYVMPKTSVYATPTNLTELLSFSNEKIQDYKKRYPDRVNVMVFMSDGEDVSGKQLEIPQQINTNIEAAIVLGYGSTTGTRIETIGAAADDGSDNFFSIISKDEYVTYFGDNRETTVDSNYNVISKINENNLHTISNALGGTYYHRETAKLPDEAVRKLESVASFQESDANAEASVGTELYWVFAIIAVALLAWEGEELIYHLVSERSKKNA